MIKIFLVSIMGSVFLTSLIGIAPLNLSQNTYAIKTGSCLHMDTLWHANLWSWIANTWTNQQA